MNLFRIPRRSQEIVGWLVDPDWEANLIWDAPHKLVKQAVKTGHAKDVSVCPAINDHEARIFEIKSPIDIHLRVGRDQRGAPTLVALDGEASTIRLAYLNKLIALMPPAEWRSKNRPVFQVQTPYYFVADAAIYITMLPAIYHYRNPPLPGVMFGGRYPIDVWPRPLIWAFEVHEPQKDIIINRGDPWFYLTFESEDPRKRIQLIEAQMTEPLRAYIHSLRNVTSYVSHTYSLFGLARARRPKILLTPKSH